MKQLKNILLTLLCGLIVISPTLPLSAKSNGHHKTQNKTHKVYHSNNRSQQQKPVKFRAQAIDHIKHRHWHNSAEKTSHFFKSMSEKKLSGMISRADSSGKKWKVSKNHPQHKVLDYKFNKPVGTSTGGSKVKTLRIVKDHQDQIITAYPVR